MARRIAALAWWALRHVCRECGGWIWHDNHRGEHADCYHARRTALYERTVQQWKPLGIPRWLSPCPDCDEAIG